MRFVSLSNLLVFAAVILVAIFISDASFSAAGNGPAGGFSKRAGSSVGITLCLGAGWFNGNLGKGIGCFAILALGICALYGKISWHQAIIVGGGLAILFGADWFVYNACGANCNYMFKGNPLIITPGR